jgi:membrane protease YdiL (CAAX protease family)
MRGSALTLPRPAIYAITNPKGLRGEYQFAGADANDTFGSAFAVDSLGGAAQLLSRRHSPLLQLDIVNKAANLRHKPGHWRTLCFVFLFWMIYALLIGVEASGALTGMLPEHWQHILSRCQLLVFGMLTALSALALTRLFVRYEKIGLADVGAALHPRSPLRFALGFLIGLTLVAMNLTIIYAVTGTRWVWAPEASIGGTIVVLFGFVAGSCAEELGFRGYPLRRLEQVFGLYIAQAVVAVAFIIYHVALGWPWVNAIFGTGAGSLLFGMAAIASRGLAVPIGLHAAWNFADWTIGGKGSAGLWKPVTEHGHSAFVPSEISFLAVTGLGILVFSLWHLQNLRRELIA